jgi:hypothetical protein
MRAAIRTDQVCRMVNVDPMLHAILELAMNLLPHQDSIQTPRSFEPKLVVIMLGNNFHRH